MSLIAKVPPIMVHGMTAVCDGGDGALGHPRVFINLEKPEPQPCGYCGLRYQRIDEHHH
jgi:NADH dehydrogenase (ubiquinone) Fe-S protein 6